ncbi:MAG: glucose 1-dehydrogenase [Lentisphaeria bacterium]|jgi:meso-butanediol dehydrogenase/(S,S)-butanediol dehydrogenase/diacetyl reductase|nr:glucose 1-dehydrogenase [Lentisphaeria bacterium]MDP7742250.1 glucose 1-dehydrogenase [Lentisphaeria bacterium]
MAQDRGRLTGKSCIVTGAGQGIGKAIAARLAAEGASVAVVDINVRTAESVAAEIENAGGIVGAVKCDVADRKSVRAMIRATAKAFGGVDVIFNNAAVAEIRPFMEIRERDWQRIMNVNGLGVLICMQEAVKQMRRQKRKGGKIINTASIAGKEGFDVQPHYCASKSAVISLTQAGARSFAGDGITVNAFCPGVVKTELWEQLDKEFMKYGLFKKPGDAMKAFSARILSGKPSTPEDIVGLAAFLASADSDYITGQSIMVDGGMIMS